jgi:hypothetical protein
MNHKFLLKIIGQLLYRYLYIPANFQLVALFLALPEE